MTIINKGILDSEDLYERSLANDWPAAQQLTTADIYESSSNLYYTNTRVVSAVTPILTTSNVLELNNLYYTNARVQAYVESLSTDLSGNTTTDLAEGNNLYYTNARVLAYLAQSDVSLQDLTVSGNLFVQGDITTLNTATLVVEDKNIVLANGAPNSAAADGAGITIDGAQANIIYASTGDKFQINKPLDVNGYSVLTSNSTTTNLSEGNNLYYTNARVLSALVYANVYVNNLVSSNLIEGNSLIIRGINVADQALLANVQAGQISGNTINTSNIFVGNILTDGITSNIWNRLYTSNVIENTNLYYTNARVKTYVESLSTDLSSNTTTDLAEGNNLYYTNARVQAYLDNQAYSTNLSGNTTTDLAEGTNLYYTNSRARTAYVAGYGITISAGGVISSTDDSATFNIAVDGVVYSNVSNTLSNILAFPSYGNTDIRYILRSIHLTNISEEQVYISGNIIYNNSNTVTFSDLMPIPYGTAVELLKREQAHNQLDCIQMQGFDSNLNPASDLISATLTYETMFEKPGLNGMGVQLSKTGVNYELLNSNEYYSIVESIRLINLDDSSVRSKVIITDANNTPLSYLAYNFALTPKSSIEILQSGKRINLGNKILVSLNANANVSAIISYTKGGTVTIGSYDALPTAGSNVFVEFDTDIPETSTLYYTIE